MKNSGPFRPVLRMGRKLYTSAYERRYNIRTGFAKINFQGDCPSDAQVYEPTDYLVIHSFVPPLNPQPTDVVFDIGCGMGRVLCVFARMNVKKCVGVEISPGLGAIAAENAKRLVDRKAPIEVQVTDARATDYSQGTIFWMFNPFGPAILEPMLDQIQKTLVKSPRRIQIAYVNPVHERVLENCPWLHCIGRKYPWWSNRKVSYWANA